MRAWAAAPAMLLAIGAVARPVRPAILVAVGLGVAALVVRRRLAIARSARPGPVDVESFSADATLLAWAAALPVAVSLTWGCLPAPDIPPDAASCADLLSPYALWRVGETLVVLVVLGLVAALVGAPTGSLGLRRPSRTVALVAGVGAIAAGPAALFIGPGLARPFFGEIPMATGELAPVVPALAFSIANGTMEEVAYRGALMGWSAPALGRRGTLAAQAMVFGLAHLGPDFVGSPLPVLAAMVAGAGVAGWLVQRSGTLAIPFALHVAVDIPLYYAFACRLGG